MPKGINLAEKNGQWNGGNSYDYYKRIAFENYPAECYMCKSKINLNVHHKNRNRKDNRKENLMIVCRDCHWKIHKHFVKWSKFGNKCKECGRNDVKHNAKGYCMACYSRLFMKENSKKYYEDKKELFKKRNKEWYEKNKERLSKKQKERRMLDVNYVEYHKKKNKEWYKKNKK